MKNWMSQICNCWSITLRNLLFSCYRLSVANMCETFKLIKTYKKQKCIDFIILFEVIMVYFSQHLMNFFLYSVLNVT